MGRQSVEDTGVAGASAAVVFADGSEWTGNAGDAVLKPRRPMTSQTSLPFDSVTKTAVATLTMRLVEQHKLALDDAISKWYPAWKGDRAATIRDLLGHTSGMHDPPPGGSFEHLLRTGRIVTPRQVLAASGKPGPRTESAEYSNSGFVMMGLILERAAGEPVSTALQQQVLHGNGLALQPGDRTAPPRADSYWYPQSLNKPVAANDGSPFIPSRQWTTMAWTAGALAGPVPALARWGQALGSASRSSPSTAARCGATPATASAPTPSSGTCSRRT